MDTIVGVDMLNMELLYCCGGIGIGGRRDGCSESDDSDRKCCLLDCDRSLARKVDDFCLRISREWVDELLMDKPLNESVSSYLLSTDGAMVVDPPLLRPKLETSDVNDDPNLRGGGAVGCRPVTVSLGRGIDCTHDQPGRCCAALRWTHRHVLQRRQGIVPHRHRP